MDLLIDDLNKRLKPKQLSLALTDGAKDFIIESAYDPIYVARPLKRFIQSKIETIVAREIIGGNLLPESEIKIDSSDGALVIEK